ncbi:hypothetical protein LY78DRAFT_79263 [Colletotrichum sublineola]|nr:hypothetical protein LY78DRAFT_79263 [Colletotrichum sublineola]
MKQCIGVPPLASHANRVPGRCRYTDRPAACSPTAVCQAHARASSSDCSSAFTKISSKSALYSWRSRKGLQHMAATGGETHPQPSTESKLLSPLCRGCPSLTIPPTGNYLARFRVGGPEVARMTRCIRSDEGSLLPEGGGARDTAAICRSLNSRCA